MKCMFYNNGKFILSVTMTFVPRVNDQVLLKNDICVVQKVQVDLRKIPAECRVLIMPLEDSE